MPICFPIKNCVQHKNAVSPVVGRFSNYRSCFDLVLSTIFDIKEAQKCTFSSPFMLTLSTSLERLVLAAPLHRSLLDRFRGPCLTDLNSSRTWKVHLGVLDAYCVLEVTRIINVGDS